MLKKIFTTLFVWLLALPLTTNEIMEDEAVQLLQKYLQVDTISPPGNESRAVEFLARIFEEEGIEYDSAESAPGRGNIWARLEGGDKPALILLHHSDVVPANEEYWDFDPLSGDIVDGYIQGRGALDMKGLGVAHLANFLKLHRSDKKLNRDIIFIAAADEESGGAFGMGWLVQNRPEVFEGAALLLNEGGSGFRSKDGVVFSIEVTQKIPVWLTSLALSKKIVWFDHAPSNMGGEGAFLVYLKKITK